MRARTIGASEMPDGRKFYAAQVKWFTTLDITPDEVHAIGLKEVARIRAEMEAVKEKAGFKGDLAAFIEFLRTDPRFYAKTPGELLREACVHREEDRRPAAEPVRQAAAPAVQRRTGP